MSGSAEQDPGRFPGCGAPSHRNRDSLLLRWGNRKNAALRKNARAVSHSEGNDRAHAEWPAGGAAIEADVAPASSPGFAVVGVGASAGGLDAFTRMLKALPVDTGMAFVLVQHLSPDRPSMLADILSRATTMPVTEVNDRRPSSPSRQRDPSDRDVAIVGWKARSFRGTNAGPLIPRPSSARSPKIRAPRYRCHPLRTATDGTLA